MTKTNKRTATSTLGLVAFFMFFSGNSWAELEPLTDDEMGKVTGREFFVSDYIDGTQSSVPNTDFGFYRLMLNANLELNSNIEHLQLGCGGINDNLDPSLCDVDMEHLRIMGRQSNASKAGDEGSLFELQRPYFEFAVKNDDMKTQREIAGIKFGSEQADGYLGVGRYNPNGTYNGTSCDQTANKGDAVLACHSGLNSVSGYLRTEMSATVSTDLGNTCFGDTSTSADSCDESDQFITTFTGTRMKNIKLLNKSLKTTICLFGQCIEANADIGQTLRTIHGFSFENTSDFFMSFQRERVAWPDYVQPGNQQTYAATANTGWWLNVPYTAVKDAQGSSSLGFTGLIDALGEGLNVVDSELGQRPPDNCFGSAEFC